jgi:hypothetical protein
MKNSLYSLCFLCILSCKSTIIGYDSLKESPFRELFNNGNVKRVGTIYIPNEYYKQTELRTGNWKEYFENGQLKESGKYALSTYTTCCTGGTCPVYYSYKLGDWIYFHDNGQLRAKGKYRIREKQIDTTCDGGDKIHFGYVTDTWNFFDRDGKEITPSGELIKEIEASSYIDEYALRK